MMGSTSAIERLMRLLLRARYRVEVEGEIPGAEKDGSGWLILPNHPAYIDPVLLTLLLWRELRPRPVYEREMLEHPLLRWIPPAVRGIPLPDLSHPSESARAEIREAVDTVVEALRGGDNVILWPAGRAQRTGTESLRGTYGTAEILRRVPGARLLRIRTRGLWGSRFSYAFHGRAPDVGRLILLGVLALLGSLFFFLPRRRVTLTLEAPERESWPPLEPDELNPWLERFYNALGEEDPTFVPLHPFLGPRGHHYPPLPEEQPPSEEDISTEIREGVAEILAEASESPLDEDASREPTTRLDQLGFDSLARMDLTSAVQQRFGQAAAQVPETVGGLWRQAAGLSDVGERPTVPKAWFRSTRDGDLELIGETIPESFLARVSRDPRAPAVADDVAGMRTFEQLAIGAAALARRLRRLPEREVGVLLPASVAADTVVLAAWLAGKIPVLLNASTGRRNVCSGIESFELRHVISARRVLDHLGWDFEGVEWLEVEKLREEIGRLELMRLWLARRLGLGLFRIGSLSARPDDTAMVLFTSGSERAPKAVPLTHCNVLSDLKAGLEVFPLSRGSIVLGFLPPFHAFGLNITSLLPILGGARVVHHPDPTASAALAEKIERYGVTILLGTPTFVARILEHLDQDKAKTLRMVVVGAESCPPSLHRRLGEIVPHAQLFEGYGTTETSPLVACTRPDDARPGTLGHALPGVEVAIVDPDSHEPVPAGERGELLVAGPIVFPGYLHYDDPQPFLERDGRRWYQTGDLVRQEEDATLVFAGRKKRFLKAGGEMISLPAIEGPLAERYPPTDSGPRVAVEGIEVEETGRSRIVLFTTESIEKESANAVLEEEGLGEQHRIAAVERLEEIPLLGSGKTDYRSLRKRLQGNGEGGGDGD